MRPSWTLHKTLSRARKHYSASNYTLFVAATILPYTCWCQIHNNSLEISPIVTRRAENQHFERSIDQNGGSRTVTIDKSVVDLGALKDINSTREEKINIFRKK